MAPLKRPNDVFLDADHAHDLITRRSITGILLLLINTPIRWVAKRQKTLPMDQSWWLQG